MEWKKMKKIMLYILFAVIFTSNIFAQVLKVGVSDGDSTEYNISDILNITLSPQPARSLGMNTITVKMLVHTSEGTAEMLASEIDSIFFDEVNSLLFIRTPAGINNYSLINIDSISFSIVDDDPAVYITYNDSTVTVKNPHINQGIAIAVDGADVIVTSTTTVSNIDYVLSGTTTDGMFKIYSDKKLRLHLNGVDITNQDGAAINIQSGKNIEVILEDSTDNYLHDAVTYAAPPNAEEEDAAFYSEGQMIISGSGNLTVNAVGVDKHGIKSDDYIRIDQGSITVSQSKKDGINANDGVFINGGTINVTSGDDGIDGGENHLEITDGEITILSLSQNCDALKCDSSLSISGGSINITVQGSQSKGLNANKVLLTGGALNISTSGGAVLVASGSGYDPSYCAAIKADSEFSMDLSDVTIVTTGAAGRGISSDGVVKISSGTLKITSSGNGSTYTNVLGQADAYHGPCINADAAINITGGDITLSHSGKGGKGISTDAQINIGSGSAEPVIHITTTGQSITISNGNYAEAKAISADSAITVEGCQLTIASIDDAVKSKESITINNGTINITGSYEGIEAPFININGGDVSLISSDDGLNSTFGVDGEFNDGSKLTINGGYVFVSSTQGDAMDSNGDIFINGGVIVAHGPQSSPEVGMDVNGVCKVTGGFLVISGTNSNMTEAPSSTSTQRSVLLKTNQSLNAGTLFHIEDANGNNLLTFAPLRRYYSVIYSSSDLTTGVQYKLYTGGTSTGALRNGLYTGGIYSGGTLRTTFSLTNMVSTISF